jgi:hypothetical protein
MFLLQIVLSKTWVISLYSPPFCSLIIPSSLTVSWEGELASLNSGIDCLCLALPDADPERRL